MRSRESKVATSLRFVNDSFETLKVFWLDEQGQRVPMATLKPGESYDVVKTYLTHPWLVADEDGDARSLYYPDAQSRTVTLPGAHFFKQVSFARLDTDKNDRLSQQESGLSSSAWEEADEDKDGFLDLLEYAKAIAVRAALRQSQSLRWLQSQDVQEELKLAADQITRVRELAAQEMKPYAPPPVTHDLMSSYFQEIGKTRAEKRIAALLDPVQRARLAQIERQVQLLGRHQALGGPLRPLRSDPAKSLQLTKEQGAKLDAIGDEYRQRIAQLPRVPPGVADPKMVAQERRSALEKIAALLTPEQKKVWDDLIGPPFLGSLPASPQAPSRPSPSGSASSSDSPLTGAEAGTLDQRYRQYAEKLIPKYDTNGDGVLTQDEWSSMSENPEAADADGDKRITVEEYARWRTAQAEKEHPAEETRYQAVPSPPSPTKTASGANSIDTKPIVIEGWGQVIDPDCDCTVKGERGKLTVNVPATLHDLNGRNGKLNAPRVLQEVEGDFVAQVRVSGAFEPGGKTTAPQSFPFNGAGLIIWADEKNYTRLERNMYLAWGIPTCFPPLFEVFKDGQYQGTDPPPTRSAFFKGESTCFRLERKGDKITAHYSHDGKEWTALKEVTVGLPKKVQVGVAAINTSDKPLTVEFDEFSVRAGE